MCCEPLSPPVHTFPLVFVEQGATTDKDTSSEITHHTSLPCAERCPGNVNQVSLERRSRLTYTGVGQRGKSASWLVHLNENSKCCWVRNHQHPRCHSFNCCATLCSRSLLTRRNKISPTNHQRTSITSSKTEQICTELKLLPPRGQKQRATVRAGYLLLTPCRINACIILLWERCISGVPVGPDPLYLHHSSPSAYMRYLGVKEGFSFLEMTSHPGSGAADLLLQGGVSRAGVPESPSARLCLITSVDVSCSIWDESLTNMSQPNRITDNVL